VHHLSRLRRVLQATLANLVPANVVLAVVVATVVLATVDVAGPATPAWARAGASAMAGPAVASVPSAPTVSAQSRVATQRQTTVSASDASRSARSRFGVTMPGLPVDLDGVEALASSLGVMPGSIMWYQQWSSAPDFPAADASRIAALGATPEITWEPWEPTGGVDQPEYSLSSIASGAHDPYVRHWAQEIRTWGGSIRLRFAEEMNGDWFPWGADVNGNTPEEYVAAWRHVHRIFTSVGATNVIWVWSPNVSYTGSTPLVSLWPGAAYVNQVGLDGYNWGPTKPALGWESFRQIFAPSLARLGAFTSLPCYITEVASTEAGGSKRRWIKAMFATLDRWPNVRGFTWFDWDKETDWPLDSSPGALRAFRAGVERYTTA
jgi:hypothetical protein